MARKKRASGKRKRNSRTKSLSIKAVHPGGDLVTIQISARLKKVPKGLRITKALLADMVRRKAATSSGFWDGHTVIGAVEGIDPRGIELKIIRWRNPGRRNAADRGWRSGSQSHAWGSLRNPLEAAGFAFR